jgi:hypothetical protein
VLGEARAEEFLMENTYLQSAFSDDQVDEIVAEAGYSSFQEMVAKLSSEGLSLQQMAERLDVSVQPFTAYHAKWMRYNAQPLNLEDV